jgi:hypothetical protein
MSALGMCVLQAGLGQEPPLPWVENGVVERQVNLSKLTFVDADTASAIDGIRDNMHISAIDKNSEPTIGHKIRFKSLVLELPMIEAGGATR